MSRLSSFTIVRPLGSGGFAKVKRKHYLVARHKRTGIQVALKTINKQQKPELIERLKAEIQILKELQHPNIVRLHNCIETPKHFILVTEYVAGGDLVDLIQKKQKLREAAAHKYFAQLLDALEYCHSRSIVHRDIKADNLLIDEDDNLKLADFGLSSVFQDGELLSTSCGSTNYAAPELIRGYKYCGPEVDVWSAGVILFSLVAGHLPFDEVTLPALYSKILAGACTFPRHFSQPLRDLIKRILCCDPVARISIGQIKNHPWFAGDLSGGSLVKSLFPKSPDERPHNWAYGFRTPVHPRCYMKAIQSFLEARGYIVDLQSPYRAVYSRQARVLKVEAFSTDSSYALDVTLKAGNSMELLEVCQQLHRCVAATVYNS